ncbi:MAG: amidase family protein, partial [Chloroflexota bacterium]
MGKSDLCLLTIEELSRLVAGREVSPVEVVEAHLERIDRLDESLGAYATVMREESRHAAAVAEREISSGHYRGPLHGIPVSLKDIYYTRGV